MFGLQYNELWGQLHFIIFTIGVNIVFFPMHFLGYAGMPRRIPDFPTGFAYWNNIMSYGTILTFISLFIFLLLVQKSFIWSNPNNQFLSLGSSGSKGTLPHSL